MWSDSIKQTKKSMFVLQSIQPCSNVNVFQFANKNWIQIKPFFGVYVVQPVYMNAAQNNLEIEYHEYGNRYLNLFFEAKIWQGLLYL